MPEHGHVESKGHGKLHGLVVLYRSAKYFVKASKTIYLDEEHVDPSTSTAESEVDEAEQRRRRGGTRQTKNIALVVALQEVEDHTQGLVVSTAHL